MGIDGIDFDYEAEIKINKHRLDRECITHAKKHMHIADLAAQASAAAARAEEKVKVIRSEIIMETIAKGGKPTGAVIEATYRTDKRHKKAKEDFIDAQETAQLLNEGVLAFRARRSSLERLVQLRLSGYYADPDTPAGSASSAQDNAEKAVREKMSDRD